MEDRRQQSWLVDIPDVSHDEVAGLIKAAPTASFLLDSSAETLPGLTYYALRTLFEVLVLVPVWCIAWIFIELCLLGWVWI